MLQFLNRIFSFLASIADRSRRPSILTPLTVQTRNKIAKLSNASDVKIKEEKENEFVAETEINDAKVSPSKIQKVEENSMDTKALAWDVKVPEIITDPLYWTCTELVEYLKKTDASFLAAVMEHEVGLFFNLRQGFGINSVVG